MKLTFLSITALVATVLAVPAPVANVQLNIAITFEDGGKEISPVLVSLSSNTHGLIHMVLIVAPSPTIDTQSENDHGPSKKLAAVMTNSKVCAKPGGKHLFYFSIMSDFSYIVLYFQRTTCHDGQRS